MDMFSSSPMMESFPSRFPSPNPSPSPTRTEVDFDFPIEVDQSFNSSMSLSCADASPTPSAMPFTRPLSGSPLPKGTSMRRPDPVPIQRKRENLDVPTASSSTLALGSKRAFGQELSLNGRSPLSVRPEHGSVKPKGKMLPPSVPARGGLGGVAMQYSHSNDERSLSRFAFHSAALRREVSLLDTSLGCARPLTTSRLSLSRPHLRIPMQWMLIHLYPHSAAHQHRHPSPQPLLA